MFYDAVKDLFGEFAAVMFLQSLVKELHLSFEEESEEGLLKALKSYVGG
ncbi:NitrOD5 domain-containing protein [Thermococcus waiotapuensis]